MRVLVGAVLLAVGATVWLALPDSEEADRAPRRGAAKPGGVASAGGGAQAASEQRKDTSGGEPEVPPVSPAKLAGLITALERGNEKAARVAAVELGKLGPAAAPAVPALIAALEDADRDLTNHALHALEVIGPKAGAAAPVVAKLLIEYEHMKEEFERNNPDCRVHWGQFPHLASDALAAFGDASIAPLIEALADPNWGVEYHAQTVLRTIGVAAAEALVRACHTGNEHARAAAVEVLGALGKERPELLEEVTRLLADADSDSTRPVQAASRDAPTPRR